MKPVTPRPNDSKWSKRRFEEASTMYIDDKGYWEKLYPGYRLERVETTVSDMGHRHTVVIMFKDGNDGKGSRRKE